jgi:hypothetical protein
MTMDGNRGSNGNDAFLQACVFGSGRWGQSDIPEFAVSAHFHRRVRSGKADAGFDRTCEFEFRIEISTPNVMGRSRNS